jgi:hypothetical protein
MMTPWFPPHIKPVHKGVYQIKYTGRDLHESYMLATWDGKKWSRGSYTLWDEHHRNFDASQKKYWRGFKEKQT